MRRTYTKLHRSLLESEHARPLTANQKSIKRHATIIRAERKERRERLTALKLKLQSMEQNQQENEE